MMSAAAFAHTLAERVKSLSWRFWFAVGYCLIAAVFVVCSFAFVYAPTNDAVVERQTKNLTTTVQADANALAKSDDAQAFVAEAVEGTDLRLTVISADGSVIADSEMDAASLQNHLGREEVNAALAGSVGTALRTSESDNQQQLYVAVPALYEGANVALRVSEPSTALDMVSQNARSTVIVIIAAGLIAIVFVALVSLKRSSMPFRRLDQVRSDFVANASHELKTPVAGIRLLSEAIRDAADVDDRKSLYLFVDRLDNEAERLQRLVVDLLDLSRLEEAQGSDRMPRADVHSTLVTSYVAHKNEAEDKGLELVLDDRSHTGDDCYAEMEPSDASLIFDNLIENAIMYTDEGSILVSFEPRGRDIMVTVKDTGIGIPAADQARVFERFYRVDKARSREVGGTGLGLSLVRHAVERSHGSISLKSEVNNGTRFTVTLPRAESR